MNNIEYIELKLNFELDKPSHNGRIYDIDDIISKMRHRIANKLLFIQLEDNNKYLEFNDPVEYNKYVSMVHLKECIGIVENLYNRGSSLIFYTRLLTFKKEITKNFIESGDFSVTLCGQGIIKNNIVYDYNLIKLILINNQNLKEIIC